LGRQASDQHYPHRPRFCCRSGWKRAHYQPSAAGWQYHGVISPRSGARRQAPGTAQAGRAGISRVAVLWHPGDYGERTEKDMLNEADVAARALGVRLQVVEARGPADFERAFSDMSREGAHAVTVQSTNVFFIERKRLVDLAAKNRLPAMYIARE